jgi:hypothetical protein
MKSDLKSASYSELVRNREETEQTIRKLRNEIISPDLTYSQIESHSKKIQNLLKFHRDLTTAIKSHEYEPK